MRTPEAPSIPPRKTTIHCYIKRDAGMSRTHIRLALLRVGAMIRQANIRARLCMFSHPAQSEETQPSSMNVAVGYRH